MFSTPIIYAFASVLLFSWSSSSVIAFSPRFPVEPRNGGFDIPISTKRVERSWQGRRSRRGDISGSIGTGNNGDTLYTVPIELGNNVFAVNVDTGSSDLWVVSDKCKKNACQSSTVPRYPKSSFNSTGTDVRLIYGDSKTGTFAAGEIGYESATVAGVAMTEQPFALMDDTDNFVVKFGTAGIFGLGFPAGSGIQQNLVTSQSGPIVNTDAFINATSTSGPLLARMSLTGELEMPMFTVMLQRDTIDISGQGMLTVGKLPDGIDNSSLTWMPVRLYSSGDGGMAPPSFAPNEAYPFRWEIDIEGVFLDGKRLPDSTIPGKGVDASRVSALIDTGNSILRGPEDVVNNVLSSVSSTFNPSSQAPVATLPCNVPKTLAFQIGGKLFPIDPRDFIGQITPGDAVTCQADNLVSTDPPAVGALYQWSLGTPFFRSNLVAFHFGNLTHPSVDPPRIGILSTVPANADQLLQDAVENALKNGGNFPNIIKDAPTASAATATQITLSPQRNSTVKSTSTDTSDSLNSPVTLTMVGAPGATSKMRTSTSSQPSSTGGPLGGLSQDQPTSAAISFTHSHPSLPSLLSPLIIGLLSICIFS